MDVFAHAASGALLGLALEPGPLARDPAHPARRYPIAGAIAATFPDVDAVSYLFGAEAFAAVHQIYTHNVLAFLALPALLALALARRGFGGDPRARVGALAYGGMALHLLGDTIATWPLRFLLPFSDRGFAFALIRSDFSLTLSVLLCVSVALAYFDPLVPHRRLVALAGLASGALLVASGLG